MSKNPPSNQQQQARATLMWEAACERVKFALQPPDDGPVDPSSVAEALRVARAAVIELEKIYWPKTFSASNFSEL